MSSGAAFAFPALRQWTPRSVLWVGGLFIGVIVALAGYDIVRGYRDTVADAGRELEVQARSVAEQTARSLQAVDVLLRHIVQQIQRGTLPLARRDELRASLGELAIGLVQIDGLVVVGADGRIYGSTYLDKTLESRLSIAGTPAFEAGRSSRIAGLMVDVARQGVTDGRWMMPLARRFDTPAGAFAGLVAARGRIDYFEDFYRDIRVESGSKITLMHQNGTLLARFPKAESSLGQRLPLFDDMLAAHNAGAPGPTRTVSPIDGIERFGALHSVPDYPLVVVVSRDVDEVLASWRTQSIGTAARTLALAALASLLLAILLRQLARLQEARESLEVSRERYAAAVAGSDDGIWDHDFAARRVFVSSRARQLSGIPPGPESMALDEWLDNLKSSIHPQDHARREAAMVEHLAGRTPIYEVEIRHRHTDGVYRWVRVRGLCVRDAAGNPIRMAGSVGDIDARKRAEEALRQSEERFALAVEGSTDGILDWDIVNDRMFTSKRAMLIAGIDSELTVRTRAEWAALLQLHPDDQQRHVEDFRLHLEGATGVRDGEYRVRHPDGQYRWVRLRGMSVRDASGRAIRWAGSVSDIDANKRVEAALRESELRYQLAVDGANQGLWDWDMGKDTLFLSARAQEFMGLEPGAPLRARREWIALSPYHPDDVPRVRQAISAHLRGASRYFTADYRLRHPSGDWHWYRQRGLALRDAAGQPYRMAGSMEDITEQKRGEDERARLEGQLLQAKKLEAMGTLAGGIAHDFNNILSAILGYGEMAQKDAAEGTAQRRHIDASLSAGMRAKSLVERILAFSRSGMGERSPVHVQSVVEEALNLVAASLAPHVRLLRNLDAGNAAVLGDPTQIHQVVMNLCTNAVHAMNALGTLTISLDLIDKFESMAATSALPGGSYVRLSVRDTGHGIAPGVMERIFDPFFTTKGVGVGTGLGLSLVHGIVTDLGGGIDVESPAGQGTTFTVYLPRCGTAAAAERIDEAEPDGCGETILLVDDEEPLVRLGEEMIAALGYEPVGFTSSVDALRALRESPQRFHAVLSDEAMPAMTGSELAKEIRAIRPEIPIVLMSGFVSPALLARARELGVAEVLAKPLVARDIARGLHGALRNKENA